MISQTAAADVDYIIVAKKYSARAKALLHEEYDYFFASFLEKEAVVSRGTAGPVKGLEIDYMTYIVCSLLDNVCNLEDHSGHNLISHSDKLYPSRYNNKYTTIFIWMRSNLVIILSYFK